MVEIKKFYKNKKVLVTGATGFKGAWLCCWLNILGAKVFAVSNTNSKKGLFYQLKLYKIIKIKKCDIKNYNNLNIIIKKEKPSIIFHFAAQTIISKSYNNPYDTFETNIRGTLNILEISRKSNFVKSIICVSTDKCYENMKRVVRYKESDRIGGDDPYSASKSSAELVIIAFRSSFFTKKKIGISSARSGNVIGGGDWAINRLIPDCIKSLTKQKTIQIRNPGFNRPWQHVLEPLKGYLILAMMQHVNPNKYAGAWNFGTKPNSLTNVKQIVEFIIKFWKTGKMKVNKQKKFYEQKNLQLDIKKAKKNLNWCPSYSIEKSVKITTDWYFQVIQMKKNPYLITEKQIIDYMNENSWN